MKRPKKLSATFVKNVTEPGRYGDGRGGFGLSLLVKPMANGRVSKTWAQRLRINGKLTNIGLGKFPVVTLAEAREKALENIRAVTQGKNPRAGDSIPTFTEAVEKVLEIHKPTWRNPRSAKIWLASLRTYVFPRLADKRVSEITTADVMACLIPHWQEKPETMRRVRRRIGVVMKWAVAQNYRGDNPAGDAISAALPKSNGPIGHFRALPYSEVGAAIEKIRQSEAYLGTKLGFEFLVLTATRSGEVRGARWNEIDLEGHVWIIPGERMKTGREFRIPLSSRAVEILHEAAEIADGSGLVFPSQTGKQIPGATFSNLSRENGIDGTPHGMRSSFRDWAAEQSVPREVAEASLAHTVGSKIERAYLRSDLFDLRRELMERWVSYLQY